MKVIIVFCAFSSLTKDQKKNKQLHKRNPQESPFPPIHLIEGWGVGFGGKIVCVQTKFFCTL